jgi:transcriptional regulator with XRE-family HTH domain
MKKAIISPFALKSLRERKGWSQQELAQKGKVTSRTILAIEKSAEETVSIQQKTLDGLSKALDERNDVLSGKAPLPAEGFPFDLHIRLNPNVRLHFDLIKRKYGVDIQDVINVAPLLFVSAAEESLQRQQEQVEKDFSEFGNIPSLQRQFSNPDEYLNSQPTPWLPNDLEPHEYFSERWHAIQIRDLFEVYLREGNDPVFEQPNPFADYLHEVSQRPLLKNTVSVGNELDFLAEGYRYWYSFSRYIPDYSVCLDVLRQITLGSTDADMALTQGVVAISEIPEDLWEPRKAGDRVAWLEDKYRQAKAKSEKMTAEEEEAINEFSQN